MSIYIWQDYSAMQWPCSDGYHVPSNDEWIALFNIWVNLWIWSTTSWWNNLLQYLLLPLAWQLGADGQPRLQNDSTYYWLCSQWTSNDLAYALWWISDTDIRYNTATYKWIWNPIRPFKDIPVIPDSSWTALYSDKIYHNSTDWLISISSDGSTWITISDKNLWATQVWNYWDTLSQNNCGNFYQRWNNYWFPFTWATSTSSTKVNAGSYWPWNYYSSSTFITYTYWDWSSVTNANLRWWETWAKPWEVQNIYIGEYVPPYEWPLRFTANTAGSYLALMKHNSPASVSLEISTDWKNWSPYTIWSYVNFSNIGDTVAFRNTSTTDTTFSTNETHYYYFYMSGSISADWDVSYLLNKNWTNTLNNNCFNYLFYQCSALITPPQLSATTLGNFCYWWMFYLCTNLTTVPTLPATTLAYWCYNEMFNECSSLTTAPSLPATTLAGQCYMRMFADCSNLETIPALPATTLTDYCYNNIFINCSKIKLSTSQTWEYQTSYRIPTTWTGTTWTNSIANMFTSTWWTFTGTPSINTTYYTSNTIV